MKVKLITTIALLTVLLIGCVKFYNWNSPSQVDKNQSFQESKTMQTTSQTKIEPQTTQVMKKMSLKEHAKMYYQFFFEKGDKFPPEPLPQQPPDLEQLFAEQRDSLKASWLGHSSLLINIDGTTILTDPLFEPKVSLVGPTRFNKQLPLKVEDLPKVDLVIISHDHYDHLNKFSIRQLAAKTELFVVPERVGKRLEDWGISKEKIVELAWWQEFQPSKKNLTIVATPGQHFSGRGLFDRNKTLWASWVIKSSNHNIFFSGDSGYFDGFKKIGDTYGPFDVTFLECGAYNEQWSKVHMFPEETVQAFFDLKGKLLQPIHWATFNLALHAWHEPIIRLTNAAIKRGAPLSTPVMGQVVNYNQAIAHDPWWQPAMEPNHLAGRELAVEYNP